MRGMFRNISRRKISTLDLVESHIRRPRAFSFSIKVLNLALVGCGLHTRSIILPGVRIDIQPIKTPIPRLDELLQIGV
jgi:hypothetical protein